jgi:gas vesicle protein
MRTSEVFVLGAITGAVVTWLWGREIADYVGERTRSVRVGAAEGMRAVDEKAGQVLDRSGHSLRRAEEFLQDTQEHVSEALRAGQEAIRPAPRTREA